MNEVIILEGADGSGKTTLAENLVNNHGFKYMHSGVPKKTWTSDQLFRHYVGTLRKAQLSKQPVVYDRHYLGETVYGPVRRDKSLISKEQRILIERLVRAGGTRVIVCAPDFEVALKNWINKKADYIQRSEHFMNIYNRYLAILQEPAVNLLEHYDYTNTNKPFERKPIGLTLPDWVIGSIKPRLLLIGEQVNGNLTSTDWAFFASTGSSGFLNQALRVAGAMESKLAFMNARTPTGKSKDLKDIIPKVWPDVVVALGKVAERECQKQGVKCEAIPHPQHTKRFGGPQALSYYAKLIGEIYHG